MPVSLSPTTALPIKSEPAAISVSYPNLSTICLPRSFSIRFAIRLFLLTMMHPLSLLVTDRRPAPQAVRFFLTSCKFRLSKRGA